MLEGECCQAARTMMMTGPCPTGVFGGVVLGLASPSEIVFRRPEVRLYFNIAHRNARGLARAALSTVGALAVKFLC